MATSNSGSTVLAEDGEEVRAVGGNLSQVVRTRQSITRLREAEARRLHEINRAIQSRQLHLEKNGFDFNVCGSWSEPYNKVANYLLGAFAIAALALILNGCGGSGGDAKENDVPDSQSIVCEHDGAIYACNNDGACVSQDQTEYEVLGEEEETGRTVARKLSTGAITVIAECGSVVNFYPTEVTITTETDTDIDSNNTDVDEVAE